MILLTWISKSLKGVSLKIAVHSSLSLKISYMPNVVIIIERMAFSSCYFLNCFVSVLLKIIHGGRSVLEFMVDNKVSVPFLLQLGQVKRPGGRGATRQSLGRKKAVKRVASFPSRFLVVVMIRRAMGLRDRYANSFLINHPLVNYMF